MMKLKYFQWQRVPKFSVFAVENMRCRGQTGETDLCYPDINKSNMGLISLTGHTGPRFEMLQLERSWLFTNHFRLNSTLRSAAEAVMAKYKKQSSCLIGVHVRRTDYKKLLGNQNHNNNDLEVRPDWCFRRKISSQPSVLQGGGGSTEAAVGCEVWCGGGE